MAARKSSSRPLVVVVGSSNTDLVMRCANLPKAGETVGSGEFAQHAGGKGANQAVAAARAGARVTFVGACGDDEYGRAAKAALKAEGIDVRYFKKLRGVSSGIAMIFVGGRSRENVIAVARSANDLLSPADVQKAETAIARADAVVCQLEVPTATVVAAAELAASHGVPFILNPAPVQKLPRRLWAMVHTLVPNGQEAQALAGCKNAAAAARALRAKGGVRVVVTMGARGALLVDDEGARQIAAPRVQPVDTVGAGDCFTAWLAVGIAEGLPMKMAAERASRAAALSVTRAGAQSGMPWRREISPSR